MDNKNALDPEVIRPEVFNMVGEMRTLHTNVSRYKKECNASKKGGYFIVDLESYFDGFTFDRKDDGVHWNALAHRHITNMLLEKIENHTFLSTFTKPVAANELRYLREDNGVNDQAGMEQSINIS